MEYIMNNYEWIFSGIGVAIIGWILIALNKNKKNEPKQAKQTNKNIILETIW